MTNRKTDR